MQLALLSTSLTSVRIAQLKGSLANNANYNQILSASLFSSKYSCSFGFQDCVINDRSCYEQG
jgi:hypothetical protein